MASYRYVFSDGPEVVLSDHDTDAAAEAEALLAASETLKDRALTNREFGDLTLTAYRPDGSVLVVVDMKASRPG